MQSSLTAATLLRLRILTSSAELCLLPYVCGFLWFSHLVELWILIEKLLDRDAARDLVKGVQLFHRNVGPLEVQLDLDDELAALELPSEVRVHEERPERGRRRRGARRLA